MDPALALEAEEIILGLPPVKDFGVGLARDKGKWYVIYVSSVKYLRFSVEFYGNKIVLESIKGFAETSIKMMSDASNFFHLP